MSPGDGITHYPLSSYAAAAESGAAWFAMPYERGQDAAHRREVDHCHDFHELEWLADARGLLVCERERIPFGPGALVFLARGRAHSWAHAVPPTGVLVAFTPRLFDGDARQDRVLSWLDELAQVPAPLVQPVGEDAATIERLFRRLLAESAGPDLGREDTVRALLTLILARARRLLGTTAPRTSLPETAEQLLALRFQRALDQHFPHTLKVGDYAVLLGVSRSHLNDFVRRATGRTASDLIHDRLLDESRRLLAHSTLTVAEIAYALRFRDPSYFGRFFRRKTGRSPGAFRDSELRRLACG